MAFCSRWAPLAYFGRALHAQRRVRRAERFTSNAGWLAPTNGAITDSARATRYLNHWLPLLLWPVRRFGRTAVWLATVAILALLAQPDDLKKMIHKRIILFLLRPDVYRRPGHTPGLLLYRPPGRGRRIARDTALFSGADLLVLVEQAVDMMIREFAMLVP